MGLKSEGEKDWELVWDKQVSVRGGQVEAEGGTSRGWSLRCSKPSSCALHNPVPAALYQCALIMNCLVCIQGFAFLRGCRMSKSIIGLRLLLWF